MKLDYEKLKNEYLDSINQGMLNLKNKEQDAYQKEHKDEDKRFRVKPTQASAFIRWTPNYTLLVGACNRSSWFSNLGIAKTNPPSLKGERRMQAGKTIELQEHLYASLAPNMKTIGNNMRLKAPLIDDVMISGELDRLMQDADKNIAVVEIKSFYGYDARKEIMGRKDIAGRPKYQHLLQVFMYMYMLQQSKIDAKYAIIHYIDRTDFEEAIFIVTIEIEDGEAYPCINGRVDREVKLSAVIARYTQLALSVKNRQLPPRDCDIIYSERKIMELAENDKISKNKLKQYTAGEKHPGDYQCSYCDHRGLCYGPNPEDQKKWYSDADVMRTIDGGSILPVTADVTTEEDGW
jgi:CRISPR/Cas system-associated exonuclease Cas4 (RecB family)